MKKTSVGLDLGTTKSVVSYVNDKGKPVAISGPSGRKLIPSTLFFESNLIFGEAAVELGLRDPDGFAEAFKRDIGKPHYNRSVRGFQVPPEVLSAFMIKHMVDNAKKAVGEVSDLVITVPAYFDEKKRTSVQQAAQLAGVQVLDIINEPTAAAIAAGYEIMLYQAQTSERPVRLLVYDLGGGTFDVTLLEFSNRTFRAVATDGDIYLGGRDFDERLAGIIADRFVAKHGIDPRSDLRDMQHLWKVARDFKHRLSDHETTNCHFEAGGLSINFELRRSEFEEAIEPLIERSLATTSDVVREAKLKWSDIDNFLLVGGSSRIPMIARKAQEKWGRAPHLAENPDELVAHGAALYAAMPRGNSMDADAKFKVINVNAHSLGIQGVDVETSQKINKILIPRNTPLPAVRSRDFTTFRDRQKKVPVRLLEGESANPDYCAVLGDCVIHLDRLDLPVPKGTSVRVSCNYAANGTISVTAKLGNTGAAAYVEMRRDGHTTLESLDKWLRRLTYGEASEEGDEGIRRPLPKAISNPKDKSEILSRLDELYGYIGGIAADHTPPAGAIQTHRLLGDLRDEAATLKQLIETIELQHARTTQFQSRMELGGRLAQIKMAWEHSVRLLQHARIALGRECVEEKMVASEATGYLAEIRQLQTMIEA